jgi:hypothetical protein
MTLSPCPHLEELRSLLALGHWPQAGTPELHAHLRDCRSCADLVVVTRAFQNARADAAASAHLASPGLLWWRAQLRRRNAAVERVGKPVLRAQIFAFSVCFLFAVGVLVSQATHGLRWLSWMRLLPQAPTLHLEALWPTALFNSSWTLPVLIPVFLTLALLSAAVVYLASEKQ